MRHFTWFAVLALVGVAWAQDSFPDAKVTYTTVAVAPRQALAEISAKTGVQLQSTPIMDREVLVLRLKDAPLGEVMRKIAGATAGAWEKKGYIYYLVADMTKRQQEAATAQQKYVEGIAKRLQKMREEMAKAKEPPVKTGGADDADDMMGFLSMGESSIQKMVVALGAAAIAQVPEGGRIVYASQPTRMQRALPGNVAALIGEFIAEYNKQAIADKQSDDDLAGAPPEAAAFLEIFKPKKREVIKGNPAKVLVALERSNGMFGGVKLEVKLFDGNGVVLAAQSSQVSVDMPFDPEEFGKPAPAPTKPSPKIELSPVSKELFNAGRSFSSMGGASNLKLSPALMAAFADPVAHDPLSFIDSEGLIAVAENRDRQLVADLPDDLLSFWQNLKAKGDLTVDSFLAGLKDGDATVLTDADGWLVVSPGQPVEARADRTDRYALRTLIQAAQRQGYVSLDDLSAYALKNDSPMDGAPASTAYIMIFAPNAVQGSMMGSTDWDLLRLYGNLSLAQRQTLKDGGRVGFGQLPPAAQNLLNQMLFGAKTNLQVETNQPKKDSDPLMDMMMSQISRFGRGDGGGDYRTEPTEVMPQGLPPAGYLQVAFTSEPIAMAQTVSTDFGRNFALSPLELGLFKFFKEDPSMAEMAGELPTFDDMKVGVRSVWNFSLVVASQVDQKGTLNDDRIPKDAPVYKMGALPDDFQKRIDDMAVKMKKNPFWSAIGKMGGMGRQTPPP